MPTAQRDQPQSTSTLAGMRSLETQGCVPLYHAPARSDKARDTCSVRIRRHELAKANSRLPRVKWGGVKHHHISTLAASTAAPISTRTNSNPPRARPQSSWGTGSALFCVHGVFRHVSLRPIPPWRAGSLQEAKQDAGASAVVDTVQ